MGESKCPGFEVEVGIYVFLDSLLWSVWSDRLVFCDYGISVSVLWCSLATPPVLLGFILLWTWGISSRLLQQSAAAAPYLGRGVSPHGCPSWPWTWSSSSRPSRTRAASAPWTWGCSSWPPLQDSCLENPMNSMKSKMIWYWKRNSPGR